MGAPTLCLFFISQVLRQPPSVASFTFLRSQTYCLLLIG